MSLPNKSSRHWYAVFQVLTADPEAAALNWSRDGAITRSE